MMLYKHWTPLLNIGELVMQTVAHECIIEVLEMKSVVMTS